MVKNYEDLTFTDDFMFCHVMQNNKDVAKGVIESILGLEIDDIINIEKQKSVQFTDDGHGVRFDICLKDDKEKVYEIEMQTSTNIDLRKRSRYYQSMLDRELLRKGQNYRNLNNSYIIFIMLQDLFKLGYNVYEFENICMFEHNIIPLEDGAKRIFVNASSVAENASPELRNLISYILDGQTRDALTSRIDECVAYAKLDSRAEVEFMTLQEMKEDIYIDGKIDGRMETALKAIPLLVEKGTSLEEACRSLDISIEEYEQAKELIN